MCPVATFNLSAWWKGKKKTQTTALGNNAALPQRRYLRPRQLCQELQLPFRVNSHICVWPRKQHASTFSAGLPALLLWPHPHVCHICIRNLAPKALQIVTIHLPPPRTHIRFTLKTVKGFAWPHTRPYEIRSPPRFPFSLTRLSSLIERNKCHVSRIRPSYSFHRFQLPLLLLLKRVILVWGKRNPLSLSICSEKWAVYLSIFGHFLQWFEMDSR